MTPDDEDRLPPLPLPGLRESCARFLEWCAPLLTADQLAATTSAVRAFLRRDSPAHELHEALVRSRASDAVGSWLDDFWVDRYLGRRDPIALNANFFVLLPHSDGGQIERAARLVAAAVDYKLRLDAGRLPVPAERGRAVSVAQRRFLFSTTRIPGAVLDTVRAPPSAASLGASHQRHVVVFLRGSMFRFDVIAPDGRPYTVAELMAGLQLVLASGVTGCPPGSSVGHLTTRSRPEWAARRRGLIDHHPGNGSLLDTIETALFCVCLDDTTPTDTDEACRLLLHGESANRWFDKSISLIVFADGTAGFNAEHSCLDGRTILDFVDAVVASAHDRPLGSAPRSAMVPSFEPIVFELDARLHADVREAASSFAAAAAATSNATLAIDGIGTDRAKQLGISPDAFVQVALQLAHKRARGVVGATYESVSMRHFRRGRTEAMRVVTSEAVHFVTTMDDEAADRRTRAAAFRAAADKHVARTKQCVAGHAPEQHLWELRLLQRRHGGDLGGRHSLALYDSPGWLTMRDDYLSTSSTPSTNAEYCGFGPTGDRCIGVAYMPLAGELRFHLSAPRHRAGEMRRFTAELCDAVHELEGLAAQTPG